MSYQVIARKWRPKTFDELVGQTHVSQTLLNALRNGRLHHALLFTGPRGTGKTSSARILAKSLRCAQSVNFVPCHSCRDCQDVAAGRSIDVIEIDGASNNGVDAIRDLRETIGYMPSSGKYKLYIIDEVHMLSTSAFNALLKTLEEPPSHVIFVLATTEAHKIPHTILSRCQRFDFRRIPVRAIASHLTDICHAEGIKSDEEALWLIARQGDGSMRDSQSLLDQVITFCGAHVTKAQTTEILGLTDRTLLLDSIDGLTRQDAKKIIEVIEKIFTAGYDPKIFIQDLLEELRNLLLIKLSEGSLTGIVDLPDSEILHLRSIAGNLSEEDIHLLFDIALRGGSDLVRAQDTRIVLEMLLLKMTSAPRIVDIFSLNETAVRGAEDLRSAEKVTSARESNATNATDAANAADATNAASVSLVGLASAPTESSNEPTISVANHQSSGIEARWLDLLSKVKRINPMVGAKLEHTCLLGVDKKVIRLGIPDNMRFLSGQVEDKEFQKKLLNYIGTFWGPGFSIETNSTQNSPDKLSPRALEEKKKQDEILQTRQQVENHPFVKSTQKIFKSQIKGIKETT
ncbi:MAG: DNA polymerase III subunit gamma/tau [Bdellovibrionales bacterium]|nr:DNA polymerase III subunit gamma/tau [Bdellovibrionales bacterium]